jgi:hypothetical protein
MNKYDIEKMVYHEMYLALEQAHKNIVDNLHSEGMIANQDCGLTDEDYIVDIKLVNNTCCGIVLRYYLNFCDRWIEKKEQ